MFGQRKVELFGETLMSFNILLSYKGSAVLRLVLVSVKGSFHVPFQPLSSESLCLFADF